MRDHTHLSDIDDLSGRPFRLPREPPPRVEPPDSLGSDA